MGGLWLTLLPLVVGSAVAPVQILITLLLLQRPGGGVLAASAFVAGLSVVRLSQGVLLALMLPGDAINQGRGDTNGAGPVESAILVVLALLMYATAVQQALADEDPDAPPPKWMARTRSMSAGYSLLLGIGLVLISAKYWVFSLSVVAAIRDSGISTRAGVLTFVAYVALAAAVPMTLIAVKVFALGRSARVLDTCQTWLERHTKPVVISFSLVFGTWFLLAGLSGLGVV